MIGRIEKACLTAFIDLLCFDEKLRIEGGNEKLVEKTVVLSGFDSLFNDTCFVFLWGFDFDVKYAYISSFTKDKNSSRVGSSVPWNSLLK